jgi:hypothetical protein
MVCDEIVGHLERIRAVEASCRATLGAWYRAYAVCEGAVDLKLRELRQGRFVAVR